MIFSFIKISAKKQIKMKIRKKKEANNLSKWATLLLWFHNEISGERIFYIFRLSLLSYPFDRWNRCAIEVRVFWFYVNYMQSKIARNLSSSFTFTSVTSLVGKCFAKVFKNEWIDRAKSQIDNQQTKMENVFITRHDYGSYNNGFCMLAAIKNY